jgi:tRNA (guanine37-N1)-methyltransferase
LIYDSIEVPAVLLSGHHEDIRKYRLKESLRQTWKKRPDLFLKEPLDKEETLLMIEILKEEMKKG